MLNERSNEINKNTAGIDDLGRKINNRFEQQYNQIQRLNQDLRDHEDAIVLARIHEYEHATKNEMNDAIMKI